MTYITVAEAAAQWNISDRRVRKLCAEGKIDGAIKSGSAYKIPANAEKPLDGRTLRAQNPAQLDAANETQNGGSIATQNLAVHRHLKWENDVVGVVHRDNSVRFTEPNYNTVVRLYTRGAAQWSPEQFNEFLAERVVSRDRRDIERILFRMGLSHYDVPRIAEITRGIHPKDMLWVAGSEDEKLDVAMTDVFSSVFLQRIDTQGDSIDTPEGYNIKRYGVRGGRYGIYKQRISPLMTDVESEIAVYLLGTRLGVPVCPATRADADTVFSAFEYDFSREYVVHFRRLFDGARSDNEYRNLVGVRPQYANDIARMILLDCITRQDDRHLSNLAVKLTDGAESFYPLYDNGRSLFYEDTEETVSRVSTNPAQYATTFGYAGTYWDYVQEIAQERGGLKGLLRLDITREEIAEILRESGFADYRFNGALAWIWNALELARGLE